MINVKDIKLAVLAPKPANSFVRKHHYSGKVSTTTKISFGVYHERVLHGVIQFGSGIDRRKSLGLVSDTPWNGHLEIGRIAFDDYLPKNSESRAISVAIKLIKKNAPHVKWVLSYADGCQCGDGCIYRAAGFKLIGIAKNSAMWMMPDGQVRCSLIFDPGFSPGAKKDERFRYGKIGEYASWASSKFLKHIGAKKLKGFQLRYIYFIDKSYESRLTVPIIPFSRIKEMGASMYKGKRGTSIDGDAPVNQTGEGGSIPTVPLKIKRGRP